MLNILLKIFVRVNIFQTKSYDNGMEFELTVSEKVEMELIRERKKRRMENLIRDWRFGIG